MNSLQTDHQSQPTISQIFFLPLLSKCVRKAAAMIKEQFPTALVTIENGKIIIDAQREEAEQIEQKLNLLSSNLKTIKLNPQHKKFYLFHFKEDIQAGVGANVRVEFFQKKGADQKTPKDFSVAPWL